jgi:hypothetical protein
MVSYANTMHDNIKYMNKNTLPMVLNVFYDPNNLLYMTMSYQQPVIMTSISIRTSAIFFKSDTKCINFFFGFRIKIRRESVPLSFLLVSSPMKIQGHPFHLLNSFFPKDHK